MNPDDLEKQMERLDALMARMGASVCVRCLKCGKLFETEDFRNGNPACAEHILKCKAPSDLPGRSETPGIPVKDKQHKEAGWIRITQENKVLHCQRCDKKTMRGAAHAEREFIETHKRCE